MRTLEQALVDHDLTVLRVIGEWLGMDLTGSDRLRAVSQLSEALAQLDLAQELAYMEAEEATALRDLVAQGGRVPVDIFSRAHGDIRLMGPGRMDREEPWLDPVSATEALWYRGFVYRGFDETSEGTLEFYYLPRELLGQLGAQSPPPQLREGPAGGLPAAEPPQRTRLERIDAVDDLTTLLALAQRTGLQAERLPDLDRLLIDTDRGRRSLLLTLATEMSLLRSADDLLRPARPAIDWLKQTREEQLRALMDAYSRSVWNDLCHVPGLKCEGESWHNDPLLARTALMDVLPADEDWHRVQDVVDAVKRLDPDFQRPDGNYDTWYIRDVETDQYLAGFANWDFVEGRLLRYLIQGPLHWLGMVALSETVDPQSATYRLAPRTLSWLADEPPPDEEVRVPILVQPDATLIVPHNAGRYERFQAGRIADAEPLEPGKPWRYRLTPASLGEANEAGITPERIGQFLEQASGRPVPPSVQRAISRWAERGVEGRLQNVIVLRVGDQAILDTLRTNAKTRDYIAESLGDLAVVIRKDAWQAFQQATAQLGLLLDIDDL